MTCKPDLTIADIAALQAKCRETTAAFDAAPERIPPRELYELHLAAKQAIAALTCARRRVAQQIQRGRGQAGEARGVGQDQLERVGVVEHVLGEGSVFGIL